MNQMNVDQKKRKIKAEEISTLFEQHELILNSIIKKIWHVKFINLALKLEDS